MFIELTEFLRCPADHPPAHCVLLPLEMAGRRVVRGVVGCPACAREYPVDHGIVRFGTPPGASAASPPPDAGTLQALLGLASPGGYVVLVGSAVRAAPALAALLDGVHFVGVNGPADLTPAPFLTLVEAPEAIPLRSAMARGVVVGGDCARAGWQAEAARVLLTGLRLVVAADEVSVRGVERLAGGPGVWVGEKRAE